MDDTDVDIDIVAKVSDDRRVIRTVLGECKFSRKPMGFGAYNTLVSRAEYAGFRENVVYVMFSALGFEKDFSEYAEENGIILIDGRMLLGVEDAPSLFGS